MKTELATQLNLNKVFFAPNYDEMRPCMAKAAKSFRFGDVTPMRIVQRIISEYYEDYNQNSELAQPDNFGRLQGDFNLKGMLEEAEIFCNKRKLASFFQNPSSFGIGKVGEDKLGYCGTTQLYKEVTCSHEDKEVFAVAIGSEIIHTRDNDCYQTAGGYRTYESDENPIVYLAVTHYGIVLKVQSSLMVDHYNNNFFGNSTGNGTTTYEKGKNLCMRTILTHSYDVKEVCAKYNLTLKKMDCERGKASLIDYLSI